MQVFLSFFASVIPLFLLIAAGYILKRTGIFTEEFLTGGNKLFINVLLPVLLFNTIYTDFSSSSTFLETLKLIAFAVAGNLIIFAIAWFVIPRTVKAPEDRPVFALSLFRSNYVMFGTPVMINILGPSFLPITALSIGILIPLTNSLSIIATDAFSGKKTTAGQRIKKIVTNPPIIGAVLGLVIISLKIKIPGPLETAITDIAKMAVPFGLLIIGGTLQFNIKKSRTVQLTVSLLIRLIALPAIFTCAAAFLGFRNTWLGFILAVFGSPLSIATMVILKKSGQNFVMADQIVVFSTLIAFITLPAFTAILRTLNLV